ncbi:MAG: Fe-S cluster assembly sulfur transfer protein SufU [Spirochaetia bacterium]
MNLDEELYREIIMENYRSTKNKHTLEGAVRHHEGANPSCGDDIELFLMLEDGKVTDVSYEGIGCSICLASANMLCDAVKGMTLPEVDELIGMFKGMLTREEEPEFPEELSDLEAMQGVRKYPLRIKCALLAWTTLEEMLEEGEKQ